MRSLMAPVTSAGRLEAPPGGESVCRLNPMSHAMPGRGAQGEIQPGTGRAPGRCSVAEERKRQIRDALADSDLFGALSDDDLDRLIEQGRTATYPPGVIVFRKGDAAEDLMIVLCGRIRLSSASQLGREVLFDFIGSGRCFGEGALIDGTTRKARGDGRQAQRRFRPPPPRRACLPRRASRGRGPDHSCARRKIEPRHGNV